MVGIETALRSGGWDRARCSATVTKTTPQMMRSPPRILSARMPAPGRQASGSPVHIEGERGNLHRIQALIRGVAVRDPSRAYLSNLRSNDWAKETHQLRRESGALTGRECHSQYSIGNL